MQDKVKKIQTIKMSYLSIEIFRACVVYEVTPNKREL